jgi:hypothetical protein
MFGYLQLSMDIVKCETDPSMIRFTTPGKTAITYKTRKTAYP